MGILVGLSILVVVAVSYSFLLKMRIEYSLPAACLSVILFSYVLSILGVMGTGLLIALLLAALLLLAWALYNALRHHNILQEIRCRIATPGLFVFAVLATALYFFTADIQAFQWDDFSHWTLTAKAMVYNDCLPLGQQPYVFFPSYPPALALWEYIFANYTPVYADSAVLYAHGVFCMLMLLPLFSCEGTSRFRWALIPAAAVAIFAIPYLSFSPWEASAWRSSYSDKPIAFAFAFLLFSLFHDGDKRNKTIYLSLGFAVLALIKNTGHAFNAFVAAFMLVSMLSGKKRKRLMTWRSLLIILGVWAAAYASWKIALNIHKTYVSWNTQAITFERVWALLAGQEEPWRYEVLNSMTNALRTPVSFEGTTGLLTINHLLYPFLWAVMLFVIRLLGKREESGEQRRQYPSWTLLVLEFCCYLFGLYLIYCYVLSQGEGQTLAGFNRYSSDFSLGVTAFLAGMLWYELSFASARSRLSGYACLTAFVLVSVPVESQMIKDVFNHEDAIQEGYSRTGFGGYQDLEAENMGRLTKEDEILLIGTGGIGQYALRKIFLPARVDFVSVENAADYLERLDESGTTASKNWNYMYLDCSMTSEVFQMIPQFSKHSARQIELINDEGYHEIMVSLPDRYDVELESTTSPISYGIEGDHFTRKSFGFALRNPNVSEKGLLIAGTILQQLRDVAGEEPITLTVRINGAEIGTIDISGGEVMIPAEMIPLNEEGIYIIECDLSHCFIPAEHDPDNPDLRDLGLHLKKICSLE